MPLKTKWNPNLWSFNISKDWIFVININVIDKYLPFALKDIKRYDNRIPRGSGGGRGNWRPCEKIYDDNLSQ